MAHLMTPADAFDLHTAYAEWQKAHPREDRSVHERFWHTIVNHEKFGDAQRALGIEDTPGQKSAYCNVHFLFDEMMLSRSDTVYLSDELRELVKTAEVTMPDEVLFKTDVYTPCGFIVMETPLQQDFLARCASQDLEMIPEAVERIGGTLKGSRLYGQQENGAYIGRQLYDICAFSWGDNESVRYDFLAETEKRYGKHSLEMYLADRFWSRHIVDGISFRVYGRLVESTFDGVSFSTPSPAPLVLVDRFAFGYGEEALEFQKSMQDEFRPTSTTVDNGYERMSANRRFALALFRLMEEYVELDKSGVPRHHSRRASRGGRMGDTKTVTTLSLRRAIYGDEEGGTGRKITLAHLVRGHWRRQWYPSQKMHRAKWINAHRRGGAKTDEVTAKPRIILVNR